MVPLSSKGLADAGNKSEFPTPPLKLEEVGARDVVGVLASSHGNFLVWIEPHPGTPSDFLGFLKHSLAVFDNPRREEIRFEHGYLAADDLRADVLIEVEFAELHRRIPVVELVDTRRLQPRNQVVHERLQFGGGIDPLVGRNDEIDHVGPEPGSIREMVLLVDSDNPNTRVACESKAHSSELRHVTSVPWRWLNNWEQNTLKYKKVNS